MTDILRTIGSIARELDSIANVEFKSINLTKGQYLYLARVCEHPGILQGELAELLRVDRTTASRAIKKLVDNGLLKRKGDPDNLKIIHLHPTKKGQEVYPIIKRENVYSTARALDNLTPVEKNLVQDLLLKIESNIKEDWRMVKSGKSRNY